MKRIRSETRSHKMNTKILLTFFSMMTLAGCKAESKIVEPPVEREKPPVVTEQLPTAPVDHPDMEALKVLSRGPRRMSVEQLERSIETIIGLPEGDVQFDQNLALSLGEPDYNIVTDESLEPSPLFMKFMVDLGGFVCQAIRDFDPERPQSERVFTRFSTLDQNLRYIMVRFTGIEGDAADPYVERLKRVYDAGSLGPNGEASGYEAVCLAVFTSPEFLLY